MYKTPKTLKIAVLHAFFVPKGGGEKLIFDIRNYYHADLYTGAIDHQVWDKSKSKTDSFIAELYKTRYKFEYLHEDSKIPFWRKIKRQIYLKYHPKINQLNNYDVVIFSGNVAGVGQRITNPNTTKIVYCHTPPRPFTDQFQTNLTRIPKLLHPLAILFKNWVLWEYKKELKHADQVVTNSFNIQKRLKDYIGLDSIVIQPAVNIDKFKYISTKDYYLSYARLEHLKRIPLIVKTFKEMPDKKLVICSSGPLVDWVMKEIEGCNNITCEGLVSNKRLHELVGNCFAGIYIPVEEDFGIIQCELMAAGKPVIGVAEGGLLETIIDGETGVLLPKNPTMNNLKEAISALNKKKVLEMKMACQIRAKDFSSDVFFQKFDTLLSELRITNSTRK